MSTADKLKRAANADNPVAQQRNKPMTFAQLLTDQKDQIALALPKHLDADTMLRMALTAFRTTPKLAECDPLSVFACVIQASQLGLRCNVMGEAYLIPFKSRGKMHCQLIPGYQGLLTLMRNSGKVFDISVQLVYEKDEYDVQLGTDQYVMHKPLLTGERGKPIFGYGVCKLANDSKHIEVMTMPQIMAIRDGSQGYKAAKQYNNDNPWISHFDEMARKTLARRLAKYAPKSPEVAVALSLDDAADAGRQEIDMGMAIQNEFTASFSDDLPEQPEQADQSEQSDEAGDQVDTRKEAKPAKSDKKQKEPDTPGVTVAVVEKAMRDAANTKELNAAVATIDMLEDGKEQAAMIKLAAELGFKGQQQ